MHRRVGVTIIFLYGNREFIKVSDSTFSGLE
jgi:hypothetical protein